jgi:glycosyltransferase involved in cell wall biosynthesis
VTFVVPVYDREDMLIDCVKSIWEQDYPRTEVILVLDGSPEGTRRVARQLAKDDARLRVIELPTQSGNAVWGRNIGIAEAKGDFIFLIDSDDTCLPGRITETLKAFAEPDVNVVYSGYHLWFVDNPKKSHLVVPSPVTFDLVAKVNPIANSAAAVRKSALQRCGMLKRHMEYREDHELWLRLCYMGCVFRRVNMPLSRIRIHGENNEARFKERDAHFLALMKQTYFTRGPTPRSIVFLLPGLGLSGGIYVVLRHANALADLGYDVAIAAPDPTVALDWYPHRNTVRVLPASRNVLDRADILVATGWQTAIDVANSTARRKLYFVQSDETRFVDDKPTKDIIATTYQLPFDRVITEARWIITWLRGNFGRMSDYAPNGVDPALFNAEIKPLVKRGKKLRVLIEGPIVIPFKGVAEAYAAVAGLDCEIWLVSSAGAPPPDWKIDRFFERVPMAEMGAIYRSCDIFLKMSRVEGFFGPPLEAMACGAAVVVTEVTGSDEFIVHGSNGLVAPMGDIAGVRAHVQSLIDDADLRARLVASGYDTATQWRWERSFEAMEQTIVALSD